VANQKYAQVTDMLVAGSLNWSEDRIIGVLTMGATYNSANTRFSHLGVGSLASSLIPSRSVSPGGLAVGAACPFQSVTAASGYQVIVCQDDGSGDPYVLAFIDTDTNDAPLSALRDGTLIIRPVLEDGTNPPPPSPAAPVIGIWMQF